MAVKEQLFIHEITGFRTKDEFWNPYPWYKKMREESPVFYDERQDTWNVFLYDHAKQVLSDYKLFPSKRDRSLIPVPLSDNKVNLIFPIRRITANAEGFSPKPLLHTVWKTGNRGFRTS